MGTYVSCEFDDVSTKKLSKWCEDNKIPNPLPMHEYHTTLLYSRKDVKKADDIIDDLNQMDDQVSIKLKGFDIYGTALVLLITSEKLYRIHRFLINCGGTHDYDDFSPHITLSYDIPEKFNIKNLKLPDIEFSVTNFKTSSLDENKYS